MTDTFTRVGLGIGVVVLAFGMAAAITSAQNTNGDPGTFSGPRRGAGGPDGFGLGRGPGGRGPDGRGGPLMGLLAPFRSLASQLDFSDAQKGQIQTVMQSHAEEWKALADRERQGRQTLDAAISADQIDTDRYNRLDVRASKAFSLGGTERIELMAQVFNLLGTDSLGGLDRGWVENALSDSFGRVTTVEPRQQAELAIRFGW